MDCSKKKGEGKGVCRLSEWLCMYVTVCKTKWHPKALASGRAFCCSAIQIQLCWNNCLFDEAVESLQHWPTLQLSLSLPLPRTCAMCVPAYGVGERSNREEVEREKRLGRKITSPEREAMRVCLAPKARCIYLGNDSHPHRQGMSACVRNVHVCVCACGTKHVWHRTMWRLDVCLADCLAKRLACWFICWQKHNSLSCCSFSLCSNSTRLVWPSPIFYSSFTL